MSSKPPPTPEEQFAKSERRHHREVEALEAAAGAAAGAIAGTLAGPIGIAAGAVIGAAIGALAGVETDRELHADAEHEKDLDAIGTNSMRGKLMAARAKAELDATKKDEELAKGSGMQAEVDEALKGG